MNDVVAFYETHPINEWQILNALKEQGKGMDQLRPPDLFEFDQDHYGGIEAVDSLAERAAIGKSSGVLDLCAGLGGPARYLAWRFNCRVTGVDLTVLSGSSRRAPD